MAKIEWHKFSEWHWKTEVAGERLDYWPSKRKWRFNGQYQTGDVERFIDDYKPLPVNDEEYEIEQSAFWSYCKVDNSIRVYVVHEGRSKEDAAPDVLKALKAACASYGRAA